MKKRPEAGRECVVWSSRYLKEGDEGPRIYVGKERKKKKRGIQSSSISLSDHACRWPLMLEGADPNLATTQLKNPCATQKSKLDRAL